MYRILLFSDLHIGSIKEITHVYDTLTRILDTELVYRKSDAIIILGDFFHKLLRVNEEHTTLAINIMSYLVRLCKKNKTKIRLLYGTESHEASSYTLFNYHLTDPDLDMKLVTTVSVEELFPKVNILYVPEEYVESKEEHYRKYLDKKYTYIFGHGIISEGMPMIGLENTSVQERKLPRFKVGELSQASTLTVFGHYHKFTELPGNVYYLGSLFRDSFGEEEPKGYGIVEGNKLTFIENPDAYIYKTYEYPADSDIYTSTANLLAEINKIKMENEEIFTENRYGKIRVIFNLPADINSSFSENLRLLLMKEKNIRYIYKEASSIPEDLSAEIQVEYDFILDDSLSVWEKICRYIDKNFPGSDLDLAEIIKLTNERLEIYRNEGKGP